MRKQSVNLWAVVVCVVLSQILQALWYSTFSESWMSLNGFTIEQVKVANTPIPYLLSIVSSSLSSYTIAWIFTRIPVKSLPSGFFTGGLFGFVFVMSEVVVKNMFSLRPFLLSVMDGGVSVIVYAVVGAVLGAWRTYD
jgi:hypothetical protein